MRLICLLIMVLYPALLFAQLKVGVIYANSGGTAEYGRALANGISLASSKNTDLSNEVQFFYEDMMNDPMLAVRAYKKLVEMDKVDLLYVWGVSACKVLSPLAAKIDFPLIGQCVDYKSAVGRENIFRFMNHTDQYATIMANHLKSLPVKKIALIVADQSYVEELAASYQKAFATHDTLLEQVSSTEKDFRSILLRLKKQQVDTLAMMLVPGQYALLAKQLEEIKWQPILIGNNYLESISEISAAGQKLEGTLLVSNSISAEFYKQYQDSFHHDGQLGFAALSYEFAALLYKIVRDNRAANGIEVFKLMQMRSGKNTAVGDYKFVNDPIYGKYFDFKLVVKQVQGLKVVEIN